MNVGSISSYVPYNDIKRVLLKKEPNLSKYYGGYFVDLLTEKVCDMIENILREWQQYMRKKFSRGQMEWPALNDEYLERKFNLGYSTRKMQATGKMYESLHYYCMVEYDQILLVLSFTKMELFRAGLNESSGYGQVAAIHHLTGFDLFEEEELLAIVNKYSKQLR